MKLSIIWRLKTTAITYLRWTGNSFPLFISLHLHDLLTCISLNTKFIIMSVILCYSGLIIILLSWVRLFVFIYMNSFHFIFEVIKFRAYCKPVFWIIKRFFFFLWLLLSFPCECIFANHQILVTIRQTVFQHYSNQGENQCVSYGGICLQSICDVRENTICCLWHFIKKLRISRENMLFHAASG